MAMSNGNYIVIAPTNGFRCGFIAINWKLGFNGHEFSQMLYGQGLVRALPFLSPLLDQ